jgi:apolipoprotein N-acyltransferase
VRAAENGVWVVHAAISGISAFIAPDGTVVERLPLWTAASAVQEINFAEDTTFYARVGDWVPLLCALLAAYFLGTAVRRNRGASA